MNRKLIIILTIIACGGGGWCVGYKTRCLIPCIGRQLQPLSIEKNDSSLASMLNSIETECRSQAVAKDELRHKLHSYIEIYLIRKRSESEEGFQVITE